jgi:zinc D-Ala-D-Ala carboxypeptidase
VGDLTQNFSAWEFRCKHTGKTGININLVLAVQKLRDALGSPISISSGYRHPTHPIEARKPNGPGVHSQGLAADIVAPGVDVVTLMETAFTIPEFLNGGVGLYPQNGFVHVDVRGTKARWGFLDGHEVALAEALAWYHKNNGGSSNG